MGNGPLVSILIVTWNGWGLLERCLLSISATHDIGSQVQVVVVDNASDDGTEARLRAAFPGVRYLRLDANEGFAAANNRGLALCDSGLVFLLNNDTVLEAGALERLTEAAESHPGFEIFVPQMVCMHDPGQVDNRGIWVDATGHFRQLDSGLPVAEERPRSEVFGGSGGAVLIRRSLLDRCALFDESLGSYLEDADFACRARAADARALYTPDARVLHEGSATGDRIADRKLWLIQRNMVIVGRRWLPFQPWRLHSWAGVAYEMAQLAKHALQGRGTAVWRAKREGLRVSPGHCADHVARQRVRDWVGVRSRPVERV